MKIICYMYGSGIGCPQDSWLPKIIDKLSPGAIHDGTKLPESNWSRPALVFSGAGLNSFTLELANSPGHEGSQNKSAINNPNKISSFSDKYTIFNNV